MNLFDLVATLSLDSSKYESGLGVAESEAKNFGSKVSGFMKGGVAVVGAITTAVTGLSVAFTKGINATASYGDNVDKMSQKIGISAEAYQKWDYVMQRAGASVDSLKMGMKTLSQQAQSNATEFQKLGISQEEVASLSQEDLFERTIKGLAQMEEGTERATIASKLLGRAGVDLGPLLNGGSEAIEEQMEIAEKYGMIMPDSAVKASAAFEDSLTTMNMTMTGLKNRLMGDFLPAMTEITDGLAKVFTGDLSGVDSIVSGIDSVVDGINQKLPKIVELGGKIVSGLADAILKGAPKLFQEGTKLVMNLGTEIIKNLPKIVSVGTDIITSVIDGISDTIPSLIEMMPDIIVSLIMAIAENLPKLIESGGKILTAIVDGLIKAVPKLIQQAPKIISSIVKAIAGAKSALIASGGQIVSTLLQGISNLWGSFKTKLANFAKGIPTVIKNAIKGLASIGKEIVSGIWSGISGNLTWIKNMISGWVGSVKNFLKKLFGIASPSKWARDTIGKNIALGMAQGIESGADEVQSSFDDIVPDYNPDDFTMSVPQASGNFGGSTSIVNYITVDGAENPEDFADRFVRRLRMDMRTV